MLIDVTLLVKEAEYVGMWGKFMHKQKIEEKIHLPCFSTQWMCVCHLGKLPQKRKLKLNEFDKQHIKDLFLLFTFL